MSQNDTILYPADVNQEVPSQQELVRRLLDGDFIVQSQRTTAHFELSSTFMTAAELTMHERDTDAGVPYARHAVTVSVHDAPKLLTSAYVQYVKKIASPAGNSWGDLQLAYTYLQALHEDPAAGATDPVSGDEYPIRSLRFEVDGVSAVGFGRAEISILGFRTRDDCRLDEVEQIVGFALEHCYLAG